MQPWRELLGRPLTVNANVSARQLRSPAFVTEVHHVLQSTRIPAGAVSLEITESMLLGDALRSLHCDLGQGFLLARPVPAAELLDQRRATPVPQPRRPVAAGAGAQSRPTSLPLPLTSDRA